MGSEILPFLVLLFFLALWALLMIVGRGDEEA